MSRIAYDWIFFHFHFTKKSKNIRERVTCALRMKRTQEMCAKEMYTIVDQYWCYLDIESTVKVILVVLKTWSKYVSVSGWMRVWMRFSCWFSTIKHRIYSTVILLNGAWWRKNVFNKLRNEHRFRDGDKPPTDKVKKLYDESAVTRHNNARSR